MSRLDRMRAFCAADPNNAFAWYSLALELKKTDRAEALKVFADVHAKQPQYLPAYYHYAKTLEESGDTDAAKKIYREGIDLAKATGDMHAQSELEAALDLL